MNKLNVLEDLYIAMSRTIEFINDNVFDGLFHEVVFVIQGERSAGLKTLGVFWPQKWEIDDKKYNEITLTSEYIGKDMKEVINTLIHEMIHFKANLLGIKDTDKSGKHHNKKFKELGEEIGCIFLEKDSKIGYSNFKFGPELEETVNRCIAELNLKRFEINYKRTKPEPTKVPKKFFKYMCPGCNATIKAVLNAEIICGTDGVIYEFRDKMPLSINED